MKPHVCPKCDGESLRMAGCAPCKGSGVVWEEAQQTLAPNPYIPIYPQPYIIPSPTIIPYAPMPVTWGWSGTVTTVPGLNIGAVFTCSGTIQ